MKTPLCERLNIEYPIFAFTHCRDVVVAVSKAGGFGVLGAVGFSHEKLVEELDWIDAHIEGHTYGLDIVIPQKYEGQGEMDPAILERKLQDMVPREHKDFAATLLREHQVPELPAEEGGMGLMGWTEATAMPLLEEGLRRDSITMIANALGTPPAPVIERVKKSGRVMAALCGRLKQARRHKEAGVDVIIAQGSEGGGHTGDVGSMVLWPQVIDAVAPLPVLAAGGIGNGRQMAAALAMGAQGVWTGSLWLAVAEADAQPAQKQSYLEASSEDTVRSRSWTGKPCRLLRNEWTEAWDRADTPQPLGMPLQGLVTTDAIRRTSRYAGQGETQKVAFNPAGQVIGQVRESLSSRQVIYDLVSEYVDVVDRLQQQLAETA